MNITGFALISNPLLDAPRFQLSPNVPVTEEFRADFNAWARRFFGADDKFIILQESRTVVVSPYIYDQLMKHPGIGHAPPPAAPFDLGHA
ncbi:MAG: hypothetical protein GAK35_01034 [Herbaspirillum frisingense]|uniref:Uncharacterized protein n=1 Tax=Herbaspirillum frisingense TaxID=92645 RepID=A0A7V8FYR5_9BURK|nr:MAG: hypothetical protein GAK35_01034 [Herbaspirillum frisingense]